MFKPVFPPKADPCLTGRQTRICLSRHGRIDLLYVANKCSQNMAVDLFGTPLRAWFTLEVGTCKIMKKILLLLIIAALGVFIYLKIQTLRSDTTVFNRTTRYELGKRGWVRTLLGLHKDGDAKLEYLQGQTPLVFEFVQTKAEPMPEDALANVKAKLEEYLERKIIIYNVDTIDRGIVNEKTISNIVSQNRRHRILGQPNIFIIFAEDFDGSEVEVARTVEEYGMVISAAKLRDLTDHYPPAYSQYVESTILHEVGHQLGLSHNERAECIMNVAVESPVGALAFDQAVTPTRFCPQELDELKATRRFFQ